MDADCPGCYDDNPFIYDERTAASLSAEKCFRGDFPGVPIPHQSSNLKKYVGCKTIWTIGVPNYSYCDCDRTENLIKALGEVAVENKHPACEIVVSLDQLWHALKHKDTRVGRVFYAVLSIQPQREVIVSFVWVNNGWEIILREGAEARDLNVEDGHAVLVPFV